MFHDMSLRAYRRNVWLVLLLAMLTATAGQWGLPIVQHEDFVVATARQMRQSGDWLVPRYRGQLRLNKPPLSYWLTAGTSILLPFGEEPVATWHGRLPSAVAGVALVAITIWLGGVLFDRRTAILAVGILASCGGYISYTHSARPEMVYALCCMGGFALWVCAWRLGGKGKAALGYVLGMWFCMGLACLAKGPHVPLMMVVGLMVFLAWRRVGWRMGWRLLRPGMGLLLMLLVAGSWWWLLQRALEGTPSTVGGSELAGKGYHLEWQRLLEMRYLYHPLRLMLPWLLLVPMVLGIAWKNREASQSARLLLCLWGATVFFLSFASHQRWYYMLPLLPAMVLLVAAGTTRRCFEKAPGHWFWIWLAPGYALALGSTLAYFALKHAHGQSEIIFASCGAVVLWLLGITWLIRQAGELMPDSPQAGTRFLSRAVLAIALFMLFAASGHSLWSVRQKLIHPDTAGSVVEKNSKPVGVPYAVDFTPVGDVDR